MGRHAHANSVEEVLKYQNQPPGIVFEVISGDENKLNELLPGLIIDIKKLRNKFPGIPVAVVTHGSEQFSLMTKKREKYKEMHNEIERMAKEENIDVHVCGTHAEWRGVTPEEFPSYVDVSAEGPAQINDYIELDYVRIIIP